ncbi:MAG: bifunctional 5,10-methylenetetrahydrofolate dehydrogenase/5,10-methenyltetrahydrofolate cyclohydrolase [Candidatus Bathyarchaeia archaeon]
MPGKMMDGRPVAQEVRSKVKEQISVLRKQRVEPNLATILVGDNPASKAYLRNIHAACQEVGINSHSTELPPSSSQEELGKVIRELNEDRKVTGVLLQLPLPKGLNELAATSATSVEKDVDGLNPRNLGLLFQKAPRIVPCTPKGVMVILRYYGVRTAGKHAVIINRTKLLGRPLSQLLLNEDATVTVCHSKTEGLGEIAKQADILFTGIGRRNEFTVGANMIKPGATVVDIGTTGIDGKLVGDVDYDSAIRVASLVTPVPGGVGPMTIAMLLYNALLTACLQKDVPLAFNPDELGSRAAV